MGDEGDADYDSALAGEATELAPSVEETSAHTAWALDDGPKWKPPFWTPGRITAAVAGVAVVVAVGAAGVVGYHLRSEPGAPVAVGPPSTGTTTPPMPPPPATVTVMPPSTVTVTKPAPAAEDVALPPGKVPFESPDPRDPQFVENIRAQGWSVADDRVVATWAHRVCGALQDGATPSAAVEHLLSEAGLSVPYPQREIDKARQFVATVISTYPQCY